MPSQCAWGGRKNAMNSKTNEKNMEMNHTKQKKYTKYTLDACRI